MDHYTAKKWAKVIAIVIIATMVLTSLSYAVMLFADADTRVYAADAGSSTAKNDDQYLSSQLSFMESLIKEIQKNYKDQIPYEQLVNGAYMGIFDTLDPYSVYYVTTEDGDEFVETVAGEFYGIGVSVENYNGKCRVVAPIAGGPAEKVGVKAGDIVTSVGGKDVTGLTLSEVTGLMKGKDATPITVGFDRDGQALKFTITREKIKSTSVYSKLLDDNIGYVQITSFDNDTNLEFKQAKLDLIGKGAKSLIIDVRNNPGGLIDTANDIADQLMPAGPIMHYEQQGKIMETVSASGKGDLKLPIALLVNEGSASASEILAGALQDSKTATLVGTTTFGKGIAQQVADLKNGGAMKLSMYYFLTPNKTRIDHVGIKPDYVVENPKGQDIEELIKSVAAFAPMKENTKPTAGQTGLNVYGAQQRLNFLGYKVDINGTMDANTVEAVKSLQTSAGLHPYGGLDKSTMTALDQAVGNHLLDLQEGDNKTDLQLNKAIELLKK